MKGFPEGEEIFRYIHNSGALATQAPPPQQPRPRHVGYGPAVQRHTLRGPDTSGGSGLRGIRQHPHRRPQQAQVMVVAGRPGRGSRGGGGKPIRGGRETQVTGSIKQNKAISLPLQLHHAGIQTGQFWLGWREGLGSVQLFVVVVEAGVHHPGGGDAAGGRHGMVEDPRGRLRWQRGRLGVGRRLCPGRRRELHDLLAPPLAGAAVLALQHGDEGLLVGRLRDVLALDGRGWFFPLGDGGRDGSLVVVVRQGRGGVLLLTVLAVLEAVVLVQLRLRAVKGGAARGGRPGAGVWPQHLLAQALQVV